MKFCKFVFALLAALVIGGCSVPTAQFTLPPTTSPSTTQSSASHQRPICSTAPEQPAAHAPLNKDEQAAFDYYTSNERHALLQQLLDTTGKRLADDLLSGRIPSTMYGWNADKTARMPVPYVGFGVLSSVPDTHGELVVKVTVPFKNGAPDLTQSPIELSVSTADDKLYTLNSTSLNCQGFAITNGPLAYRWSITSAVYGEDMSLSSTDGTINDNLPLDPRKSYIVLGSHGSTSGPLSVENIKAEDAKFLRELNNINMNSSHWH